jgi:hypothetical protein
MLTPKEKEEIKKELQYVQTAKDLFDYLENNYELKDVKLGMLIKPKMVQGVIDIISTLNAKKKVHLKINRS